MLRYVLVRDPQQWAEFDKTSSDLNHWIDDHDASLNSHSILSTDNERKSLSKLMMPTTII